MSHIWGVSAAGDRVWGQVSGLRPDEAGRRLFIVLQAFVDESWDDSGTFVMGGCVASAESWTAFSREWEQMLPQAGLVKNGKPYFKMSDMTRRPDRMALIPAFFDIIERHAIGLLSAKINRYELKRAISRIVVPNTKLNWDLFGDPYYMAFRATIDSFHGVRPQMPRMGIALNEKVDFYFDEHTKKKAIIASWDDYIRGRPEDVKQFYGATPRFEHDDDFLPLQAADFWAWWVRKSYQDTPPEKMIKGPTGLIPESVMKVDFGIFKLSGKKNVMRVYSHYDENALTKLLIVFLRARIPSDQIICDLKPFSGAAVS